MQSMIGEMALDLARELESTLTSTMDLVKSELPLSYQKNHQIKLCPIPSRPQHLFKRGFSPQHLLADRLAYHLGDKFVYDSKSLVRRTISNKQTGSSRQKRLRQQEQTLAYYGQAHDQVIIVDDVVTTGATLKEAQRALKEAQALLIANCLMFISTNN